MCMNGRGEVVTTRRRRLASWVAQWVDENGGDDGLGAEGRRDAGSLVTTGEVGGVGWQRGR